MPLNNVTITEATGGTGRVAAGEDHISGIAFYCTSYPSGFSSGAPSKAVNSLAQAVGYGILNDYSDETKATGTVLITATGANGDSYTLSVVDPILGATVVLGSVTKTSTLTTTALIAAELKKSIASNEKAGLHKFIATVSSSTITITAPKGYGISLNSGSPLVATIVGATAATITQFSGGVASELIQWYYHVSEFFRMNPQGRLFINFTLLSTQTAGYTFTNLTTLQNYASGKIRQMGVYIPVKYPVSETALSMVTTAASTLNTIAEANKTNKQPFTVVLGTSLAGVSDLSTLSDLNNTTYKNVSVVVGQDGKGQGYKIYKQTGLSSTCVGTTLGAVSASVVGKSIAHVAKFNVTNGIEFATVCFSNGAAYDIDVANTVTDLNYIFMRTFPNLSGVYFNDEYAAIIRTSDYAYISDNRVSQKILRLLYAAYTPQLSGSLQLNTDGTMTDATIEALVDSGESALDVMIENDEISQRQILIDASQDVSATGTLAVNCKYIKNAISRNITITLTPSSSL